MPHNPRPPTFPALDRLLDTAELALKSARNLVNRGAITQADLETLRSIRNQLLKLVDSLNSRKEQHDSENTVG